MSNAELRALNEDLVGLLTKMRDRIDDKLAEIAAIAIDDDDDDDAGDDDDDEVTGGDNDDDDDEFSSEICDEN